MYDLSVATTPTPPGVLVDGDGVGKVGDGREIVGIFKLERCGFHRCPTLAQVSYRHAHITHINTYNMLITTCVLKWTACTIACNYLQSYHHWNSLGMEGWAQIINVSQVEGCWGIYVIDPKSMGESFVSPPKKRIKQSYHMFRHPEIRPNLLWPRSLGLIHPFPRPPLVAIPLPPAFRWAERWDVVNQTRKPVPHLAFIIFVSNSERFHWC